MSLCMAIPGMYKSVADRTMQMIYDFQLPDESQTVAVQCSLSSEPARGDRQPSRVTPAGI